MVKFLFVYGVNILFKVVVMLFVYKIFIICYGYGGSVVNLFEIKKVVFD